MANTVDKVIKIAEAEVGYLEKSKSAYQKNPAVLDKKTEGAGSDNYTKYGRDMHKVYPGVMDFPAYWCDCFVDWCFYKAYGTSNAKALLCGNFDDYTVNSAQLYKNKNAYIKRGSGTPKVGDQIFFRNDQRICHTGLVYKVDSTTVYTIEGNTSTSSGVVANGGGVSKKSYSLTNTRIDGYGRPKYDTNNTKPSTPSKNIPTLAKPTLRNGSKGTEVKNLQNDLNYTMKSGLVVDGSFGAKTTIALKGFQKKYGLVVDGVYGPKSQAKMKTLLK